MSDRFPVLGWWVQSWLRLPAGKLVTSCMMTGFTGISEARCQLILTQLVLAGLAKDDGGFGNKFRRCQ